MTYMLKCENLDISGTLSYFPGKEQQCSQKNDIFALL